VCSGEGRTVRQILEEMLQIASVAPTIKIDRDRLRPADLPNLVGDPAKLRKLGWTPSRTLADALREVLEHAAMEADAAQ
jgi:GDP-4-dehydro-6-deoxy-D-mannose reductase